MDCGQRGMLFPACSVFFEPVVAYRQAIEPPHGEYYPYYERDIWAWRNRRPVVPDDSHSSLESPLTS